ncbi:hypothetical protein EJ05DRAFT_500138 [Pseudovirgaria hyperparasitica]|uniref:DH domain-containing protein n=1 Tax=Pseudovirgaria hyperparasitica TaxID=470096 RepID=A0A6A6W8T9_9PEZI|nr:uncharacterized protein EJ05DRAFT_500138 [Pseudovirgaria hyperparasitica]KAF2758619.1 hypothetical protein EJ05DRAFT_500138 [Pseudovirgaria hyperparasitica]
MAYILSLPPLSPLKRSFSDTSYIKTGSPRTTSPLVDDTSTIRHFPARNVSGSSLLSLTSIQLSSWTPTKENVSPRPQDHNVLDLLQDLKTRDSARRHSQNIPRKPIWVIGRHPHPERTSSLPSPGRSSSVSNGAEQSFARPIVGSRAEEIEDILASLDESCGPFSEGSSLSSSCSKTHISSCDTSTYHDTVPEQVVPIQTHFRRWMSTLRRRKIDNEVLPGGSSTCESEVSRALVLNRKLCNRSLRLPQATHEKSLSLSSSMGFVTTVKSASITLASTHRPPWATGNRSINSRRDNSGIENGDARISTESTPAQRTPLMDERSWDRARKRGEILSELLATEESYISDMKALVNVYFTLLASIPSFSTETRRSFHRNVAQIIQLHEDLLRDLHAAIPGSESIKDVAKPSLTTCRRPKHVRWKSAEAVSEREVFRKLGRVQRHSIDIRVGSNERQKQVVDTITAGSVAKVFNKYMKRFFAYEQYVAHFEEMKKDMEQSRENVPLSDYERGIEALSTALLSLNHRGSESRKGLTVQDLFIKPVQRVTKLCLMLETLSKQTPVYDDPESHAELEKALFRMRETNREIDRATNNPAARKLMEISWILQDRFDFEHQTLSKPIIFSLLGHVMLCGVLHIAYQANDRVLGQYMICALYRSCLILATPNRSFSSYSVVAAIALAGGSLEEADNGKGLQCYTAAFTWKLVFESEHKLYEIVMSACSAEEEEQWRRNLRERIASENHDFAEGRLSVQDIFACRHLDLKSLGSVFGQAESFVRRLSVHRAQTLGPRINIHQVIIKNTQARKLSDPGQPTVQIPVARSHSLLSTNNVPILTPRRAERVRLENALVDVWTKEVLPYPGMSGRRSENSIRASANAVMRKMSMASLTSNFSKRSASVNNLSRRRAEDALRSGRKTSPPVLGSSHSIAGKRPSPPHVDFHNDPLRFLPADFDLADRRHNRIQKSNRVTSNRHSIRSSRRVSRPTSFIAGRNRPRSDISMAIEASSTSLSAYTFSTPPNDKTCTESEWMKPKHKAPSGSSGLGTISKTIRKQKSRFWKFLP